MTVLRHVGFTVFLLAAVGCASSDGEHKSQGPVEAAFTKVTPGTRPAAAASFVGHVDGKTRKVTFTPVAKGGTGATPQGFGLDAASLFTLDSMMGGDFGMSYLNCPADPTDVFCTDVSVTNTSGAQVDDVYVEITSITLGGVANSDAQPNSTYNPPLTNSIGEFSYGSLMAGGTGVKLWKFNDPGQADFTFNIDVMYTHTHTSHSDGGQVGASSVNACTTGTVLVTGGGDNDLTFNFNLAFPISIYGQTISNGMQVNAAENGFLEFNGAQSTGSNNGLTTGKFVATNPVILAFWDDLSLDVAGRICHQVSGSSPNRTHTVTWENMDISSTGSMGMPIIEQITFSIVISEQSDSIDLVYEQPGTGVTPDTQGSGATIGIQGPVGGLPSSHQISINTAVLPAAGYPVKYTLTGN